MTAPDLRLKEREMREELFRFRLKLRTNQLENASNYKRARRDLARLLTVIRQKEGKPGEAETKANNAAAN